MTKTGTQVTPNASKEHNGREASIKAGEEEGGGVTGDRWDPKVCGRMGQDRTSGRFGSHPVPPDSWYLRKVLELML